MTVIKADGTQQVLEKLPPCEIKVNDFRGKKIETMRDELRKIEFSMVTRNYPLGEWPYFDLQVSRIDDEKSMIHLSIDLIIADGPSIEQVQKKLFFYYENPNEVPLKINISFRDYVLSLAEISENQKLSGESSILER